MSNAANPGSKVRRLLSENRLVVTPGVFDGLSARLAQDVGFEAVYMSGYAVAGAAGFPDVGMLTMAEVASQAHTICSSVDIPVIADADTGYGTPLQVMRTVRFFEDAGLAGLELEDQREPKRCGFMEGTSVIDVSEMQRKIEAAISARKSDDFLIVGRTDCVASLGFDEALRRVQAYEAAGADAVLVVSPTTDEELAALPQAVSVPTSIVLSKSFPMPTLDLDYLERLGYRLVVVSSPPILAAAGAMKRALQDVASHRDLDQMDWPDFTGKHFNELMGIVEFQEQEAYYMPIEEVRT